LIRTYNLETFFIVICLDSRSICSFHPHAAFIALTPVKRRIHTELHGALFDGKR